MGKLMNCWVIPTNAKGEPWKIDEDETKPVYLKHGMPIYKEGELFNYRLSSYLPGEEECQEIEKGCEGYQFSIDDFV